MLVSIVYCFLMTFDDNKWMRSFLLRLLFCFSQQKYVWRARGEREMFLQITILFASLSQFCFLKKKNDAEAVPVFQTSFSHSLLFRTSLFCQFLTIVDTPHSSKTEAKKRKVYWQWGGEIRPLEWWRTRRRIERYWRNDDGEDGRCCSWRLRERKRMARLVQVSGDRHVLSERIDLWDRRSIKEKNRSSFSNQGNGRWALKCVVLLFSMLTNSNGQDRSICLASEEDLLMKIRLLVEWNDRMPFFFLFLRLLRSSSHIEDSRREAEIDSPRPRYSRDGQFHLADSIEHTPTLSISFKKISSSHWIEWI